MTSWPSLRNDLLDAGGEWTEEEAVIDKKLGTRRKPSDIPVFSCAFSEAMRVQCRLEAGSGIEPLYEDLQSSA